MPTVDERLVQIETKMIPDLRDDMRRGFADVAASLDRIEKRFEQIDGRFDQTDKRLERLESRVERLDEKIDRGFMWIVSAQFTMMVIFIGALVATYVTAKNNGGQIKLVNLTKRLHDLLVISKLVNVFETFDSEDEAVRSFPAGTPA